MSAPLPIPTLPISSATAAQSVHIASLTTQLQQLVEKNNGITSKLEQCQREGRERLEEEVRRSDDIVRQMKLVHEEEIKAVMDKMEKVSSGVVVLWGRALIRLAW